MYKMGILSSEKASLSRSLLEYFRNDNLVRIEALIYGENKDLPDTNIPLVAKDMGVEIILKPFPFKWSGSSLNVPLEERVGYTEDLAAEFARFGIDVVALDCWRLLLPDRFLRNYKHVFSTHLADNVKYGGRGMFGNKVIEKVLRNGEAEITPTIMLVQPDRPVDRGEVISREKIEIDPNYYESSKKRSKAVRLLREEINAVLRKRYPETIKDFLMKKET